MQTEPQTSALEAALSRVGDRWSLLIVAGLRGGPRRFTELVATIEGIAPNILTDRLRRLERAGVISARPYSRRPLRVAYELSDDGRALEDVLRLLAAWGAQSSGWRADEDAAATDVPRHDLCGTVLEARWYCSTCAHTVDEDAQSSLHFA